MKKTDEDFDESILDSEEEFKKRFRPITRAERPNAAINRALKESKSRITIYLDPDIIEHFKKKSEETTIGYQTLINQTLREKINGSQTAAKVDELIEKLLRDKNALRRLKAELERV